MKRGIGINIFNFNLINCAAATQIKNNEIDKQRAILRKVGALVIKLTYNNVQFTNAGEPCACNL